MQKNINSIAVVPCTPTDKPVELDEFSKEEGISDVNGVGPRVVSGD